MYQLYDYQLLAVNQLREKMREHKRVCLCLPTGGGKTIIFSDIANKAIEKGKRVLVCVHRNELKEQAQRTTNATVVMVETLNNQIKANKIEEGPTKGFTKCYESELSASTNATASSSSH